MSQRWEPSLEDYTDASLVERVASGAPSHREVVDWIRERTREQTR